VPAAAVIPAPIAYIKVAAVKKLVVGSQLRAGGSPHGATARAGPIAGFHRGALRWVPRRTGAFTLKKLECSKQANACTFVHGIMENGLGAILLVFGSRGNG
jgi:hypothetical protein